MINSFSSRSKALVVVVIALLACLKVVAATQTEGLVTRLYVFGDSYSDSGAGYVDGNGPTAVVYLSRRLGFELIPATEAGDAARSLNFAVSGAQTGSGAGSKIKDALLGRGMMDQVDDFVARVKAGSVAFDPKTTLFFLAGGLNDGNVPGAETVANLQNQIRKLHAVGARRFRVALMPEEIPETKALGVRLNPELRRIPEAMRPQLPDARIALSNWGAFFDEVMQHPARYGIQNTKDKCAGRALFNEDATPCADPSTYFYYHEGHPSTAVHKVVGDNLYEELAGENLERQPPKPPKQVGAELKPIPFADLTPGGLLKARAELSFRRLQEPYFQWDHVSRVNFEPFPGDAIGRTINGLTLLSQALHQPEPASLKEIMRRGPEVTNADGYLGPNRRVRRMLIKHLHGICRNCCNNNKQKTT